MAVHSFNKFIRFILKSLLWILGSILAVLVLIAIVIQFPTSQHFIKEKAVSFLSEKLNTRLELGNINISFSSIQLEDVFIEDLNQDTLWYSKEFFIGIDLLGLFNSRIEISSVEIEKATGHIYRTLPDSSFNFDFIIEAFAEDKTEEKQGDQDKENGWTLAIFKVNLDDIYFTLKDDVSGTELDFNLGKLFVSMDEFDLERNNFEISLLEIDSSRAAVVQNKIQPESEDTEETDIYLILDQLTLSEVALTYHNIPSGQKISTEVGASTLLSDRIKLSNQELNFEKLELHNSHIIVEQYKETSEQEHENIAKEDVKPNGNGWTINLDELNFSGNSFRFDNFNEDAISENEGIDFDHMFFENISAAMSNLQYSDDNTFATVQSFSMKEKSGFKLEELSTFFIMDTSRIELRTLELKTANSRINDHLVIGYSSLDSIKENFGDAKIHVNFEQSTISIQDLLFFLPELSKNPVIAKNSNNSIDLRGKIDGPLEDLLITQLELKTAKATRLRISGRIIGLLQINKSIFDIDLEQFFTGRNDIQSLLPIDLLPSDIYFPEKISARGNFKGSLEDFLSDIRVRTSQGDILADVSLKTGAENNTAYAGKLEVRNYNVGELLQQQENLGNMSITANIDGSGFSVKEMNLKIDAIMEKAMIKEYEYKDLKIDGVFLQEQFTGRINLADENLVFNFDGLINLKDSLPDVNFNLNLQKANLKALYLTEEDYRIKGLLQANMIGNSLENLNGNLGVRDVLVIKDGKRFPLDSLLFVSVTSDRYTDISIHSDFMNAWFKGTINLADLPEVMHLHLHQYFRIHDHDFEEDLQPQNFDFEVKLFKTDLLTMLFIPEIQALDTVLISGRYNNSFKILETNVSIEHMVYSDFTLDSIRININSDEESLDYSLHLAEISDSLIQIKNPAVIGLIENNNAEVRLQLTDEEGEDKFVFPGTFSSMEDDYRFSILTTGLIINYEEWDVPEDNNLLFDDDKLIVHNMRLQHNDQFISINSTSEDSKKPPLEVTFNEFDLGLFSRLIQRQQQLFSGTINGNIIFKEPLDKFSFTSELTISDLSVKEDTLGNLFLKADNIGKDRYNIKMEVSNDNNYLNAEGFYLSEAKTNPLNFMVQIGNFDLATVEAYTGGQLTQLTGSLAGEMEISGTFEKPEITGGLHFKKAAFNLTYLNSYLIIKDEKLEIDESGISFKSFMLTDTLGNEARINGHVFTENYRDYQFELDVNTDNFLVLNTTSTDNDLYYGNIFIDSDITIRGNLDLPIIDAKIKLLNNSDLTFVVPADELATLEREGVVEFIDRGADTSEIMEIKQVPDSLVSELKGIDLTTNVEVDKETRLKIVIDEVAGDYLEVLGNGTLSFGIDPGGEISLSGRYEITEGNYLLTFREFIKREFDIKQGSSITWAGDPLDAQIDITAIYLVRTSPYELLASTTTEVSEQNEQLFKQQLPFQVHLLMEGALMSPEISFELNMAEDQRSALDGQVYAKLQQLNEDEAELNKQVFALLVLNRFISEDIFAGGGGGYASAARSSVSKILTEQLNRLSAEYIKGLDLTLGLESYSTGQDQGRTELQLGLSRKLLDDRITVKVEGNVDLEGEQREQAGWTDIAGDVSIEYNITEDGRYKLKVFRESEFQGIIDGNIIETGISIIYNKDYERFIEPFKNFVNELFKWEKKKEDVEEEEKKEEEERKKEQASKERK